MTHPLIEKLPDELINQIKAGEVVERPASVVKELVENSIDAKASLVFIELLDGGKQLIRITDNGIGISNNDLPLALERHATSKIKQFSDLEQIKSFGFRGEALPSIASVSEFTIKSKPEDQKIGHEIQVSHGKIVSQKDCAMTDGTVMQAKDLFAQIPVRLKFLKSTSTEYTHIYDFLLSISFYYHSISFRLNHNGRDVFFYKAKDTSRRRFDEILGQYASDYVDVAFERGSFKVTGFSLLPHKASSLPQYFVTFVNGRLVKDKVIRAGVLQAYQGLVLKGLLPSCVIFVDVDPTWIDVNVHPSKTEVRFTDPIAVQELIAMGVQNAIKAKINENLATAKPDFAVPSAQFPKPAQPFVFPKTQSFTSPALAPSYARPSASPSYEELRPEPKQRPHLSNLRMNTESFSAAAQPVQKTEPAVAPLREDSQHDKTLIEITHPLPLQQLFTEPAPSLFTQAQYLGQYSNCYLIMQLQSELWILDQHAFHERILFEEYITQYSNKAISQQSLLTPFIVTSNASISAIAKENSEKISRLGFEIEILSNNNIAIHSYPAFLSTAKIPATFDEILGKLIALSGIPQSEVHPIFEKAKAFSLQQEIQAVKNTQLDQTHFYHLFYATLACHNAVRSGDALNAELVQRLLARSTNVDFFAHCPHGRPVLRKFSQKDVEAWFMRI